jgi:Reverse transcriptase (RNA-dependent DNA polymerase)
MNEELKALEKKQTWTIMQLPKGKKTIEYKWVYKLKHNNDGTIERYKPRLVAKDYIQIYDIDYQEICAPVVKMNTIRFLFFNSGKSKLDPISIGCNKCVPTRNVRLRGTTPKYPFCSAPFTVVFS